MRLLTFNCRAGHHDRCNVNPLSLCKCTCHKIVAIAQEVHRTVAEVLDQAANVIRTRLDEIDDELARYNDLRGERKTLEAALKRLQPKERAGRAPRGSIATRILEIIQRDPAIEWAVPTIAAELDLEGNTTVGSTCTKLCADGQLARVGRGVYKAA